MICSKKTSSTHWLDRLRSARGFPTADGVNFSHFIAAHTTANESITNPKSTNSQLGTVTAETMITGSREAQNHTCRSTEEEEVGLAHVLCDLFVMGCEMQRKSKVSSIVPRKKSLRKQRNPRFCSTWSKGAGTDIEYLGNSRRQRQVEDGDTQNNGAVTNNNWLNYRRENSKRKLWRDNEEEEEEDLLGYSKNEVTVIDSSIEGWKMHKYLFRKRKVWKVKEKKRKSSLSGNRKRRLAAVHWGGKDGDGEKKRAKKVKKKPNAVMVLDQSVTVE